MSGSTSITLLRNSIDRVINRILEQQKDAAHTCTYTCDNQSEKMPSLIFEMILEKKHVCVVEVLRFNDPLYLQKNMNYNKMVIQQSI